MTFFRRFAISIPPSTSKLKKIDKILDKNFFLCEIVSSYVCEIEKERKGDRVIERKRKRWRERERVGVGEGVSECVSKST